MPKLTIIRGMQGSGKTQYAGTLANTEIIEGEGFLLVANMIAPLRAKKNVAIVDIFDDVAYLCQVIARACTLVPKTDVDVVHIIREGCPDDMEKFPGETVILYVKQEAV